MLCSTRPQRGRDAGIVVIPAAQALADVGDDRDVARLVASCAGGVVALRSEDGERLARLGGHDEAIDRQRTSLHPDAFGRLRDGEGYMLLGRESAHVQVIRNQTPAPAAQAVAYELRVLAGATEGPLRAQAWRMAAIAGSWPHRHLSRSRRIVRRCRHPAGARRSCVPSDPCPLPACAGLTLSPLSVPSFPPCFDCQGGAAMTATAPEPIPDPRRARWDTKPLPPPAPWDRTAWALAEDAIDLFVGWAGITDPARVELAKRRALAEIRRMYGPSARVVGG